MVSEPREGVLPCTWKNPPLRHPLLIDKSKFDDLHFFCITFLLRHVILFLIKPRQIRPGKLGFWCDIVCQFGGGGGGYIRQACSPLIQLFFGFASDIDQTNINRDIRDGNWLSRPAEIARKVLLKLVETRTSQSLSGFVLLLTWELCLGGAHAAAWSIKTCVSGEV